MTPLPRGECVHCHTEVALRKGGKVREHHLRLSSGPPAFSQPEGTEVRCGGFAYGAYVCPGSGHPVAS
jgi:hypothetical protein